MRTEHLATIENACALLRRADDWRRRAYVAGRRGDPVKASRCAANATERERAAAELLGSRADTVAALSRLAERNR